MEAWDTLVAIEEGVGHIVSGAAEPSWDDIFVVAHRLKGAASLHGFAAVATLAMAMEQALRPLPGAPPAAREAAAPRVTELLRALKSALEAVERGEEPAPPDALAIPKPPPATAVAPATSDPLREELGRFFAANNDALAYFGPEAAEHLDAMTTAMLALEREGP